MAAPQESAATAPQVLFANVNQTRPQILTGSLAELAESAASMGYDGVEFTTVRSRAMWELLYGDTPNNAVRSFHEGYPCSMPIHPDRFIRTVLNVGYSTIMRPSTLGRFQPGAQLIERLRDNGYQVPSVGYPHWQPNAIELDRRKVARLGGEDVSIQPAADVHELWSTDSGPGFVEAVQERNYKICLDTFHVIRNSRATGKQGLQWRAWLPEAAGLGLVTRLHLGGWRTDFASFDPDAVERNAADIDKLIFGDELTGELKDMVTAIREAGSACVKAVVVEIPRAGARRALEAQGYEVSASKIQKLYARAAQNARRLFATTSAT